MMARTSENGDADADPHTSGAESSFENPPAWAVDRIVVAVDPIAIKQELLVDLDQLPQPSVSINIKDWTFASAATTESCAEQLSGNDIIQGTVLFGSNITDSANKQKIERILEHSAR